MSRKISFGGDGQASRDRLEIVHRSRDDRYLLVPVRLGLAGHAQLEPVHGARTGQRNAAVALPNPFLPGQVGAPDSQRQHAVGPELVMVVDVLVTQQKAEQPLGDQLPHRMLDPPLAPVVLETGPPAAASGRGSASAWRNSSAPPSVLSRPPSPTTLRFPKA